MKYQLNHIFEYQQMGNQPPINKIYITEVETIPKYQVPYHPENVYNDNKGMYEIYDTEKEIYKRVKEINDSLNYIHSHKWNDNASVDLENLINEISIKLSRVNNMNHFIMHTLLINILGKNQLIYIQNSDQFYYLSANNMDETLFVDSMRELILMLQNKNMTILEDFGIDDFDIIYNKVYKNYPEVLV